MSVPEKMNRFLNIFLLSLFLAIPLRAQTKASSVDSAQSHSHSTELDTTVAYEADEIISDAQKKITRLIGHAHVTYEKMGLTAGLITINWDKNLLTATGLPDTQKVASPKNPGDTLLVPGFKELPVFTDGSQKMSGFQMTYNFDTQKGRVIRGRTAFEDGFYTGEIIKRVSKDVYFVKGGTFTTCNLPQNPHYHFYSTRMKLLFNDKVIAKPIILYIRHIPIAALPFGMFPNKSGRHSGFLIPRYGESAIEGRYLRDIGYYWAASQYWDTVLSMDYFEKTGFLFHGNINYMLRYLLRGRVSASLVRKTYASGKQRRWDLSLSHSQTFDPTMSLRASGLFVSDKSYYRDFSSSLNQRLNREIRSNATFSKYWRGSGTSISVNVSRTQNLDSGTTTDVLPQVFFRAGRKPIIEFFRKKPKEIRPRRREMTAPKSHWYDAVYLSYNSQFLNRRYITEPNDTTRNVREQYGVQHQVSLNSTQKIFHWISTSQNLSYQEVWSDHVQEHFLDPKTNQIESRDVKQFSARRTFSTSFSANTKLYGTFFPNRFGVKALRHVMTPSLSFGFRPDFSSSRYGYYETVVDTTGRVYHFDRFGNILFGGTSRGGSESANFSVYNIFQMKTGTEEKMKKINLFTLNLSSGYNFKADSLRLSPIVSSFRSQPKRNTSLLVSAGFSPYGFNPATGRTINLWLASETPWSPVRLINFNSSLSFRLNSRMFQRQKKSETRLDTTEVPESRATPLSPVNRFSEKQGFTGPNLPWSANFSLTYNVSKYNPIRPQKTFWLNMNSSFQLTKKWKINYTARFDMKEQKIVSQNIVIYRDLHCWEARIVWYPTGPYKHFYLRINIKSPLLKELKLEKRTGRAGYFGGFQGW